MKLPFLAAAIAATSAMSALAADGVVISDPYARASSAMSQSGAAFMRIENHGTADQRLVAAQSDAAARVELHTHSEDADGVMRMFEVEEGFVIPAGGVHVLDRGGDHIMFLGLTRTFAQGDEIALTLIFESGDDLVITVPVDLERMPEHGHGHGHGHSRADD